MVTKPAQIRIDLPLIDLAAVCREFAVAELSIFGSVLRDEFRADSDVDFLVTFDSDDLGPWMGRLTDFEAALSKILGRKADVVLRSGVEQSPNYIRRRHILNSAQRLYVA